MAQQKITFNEVSTNTAIVTSQLDSASSNGTGAILVPSGTTTQRPAATTSGYIRFNSTLGSLESANGSAWANVGSGGSSSGVYDANTISVGYFAIPQGNTAQKPANPPLGALRWNTSNTAAEMYVGNTIWQIVGSSIYSIDYLVVAGGGSGGRDRGGGGGAGGAVSGTTNVIPSQTYTFTLGAGAATTGTPSLGGIAGSNSTGFGQTATGGGGGVSADGNAGSQAGGSGGGGAGVTNTSGGAGTSGQGNAGGTGVYASPNYGAGGGGGAGASGSNGTTTAGGNGGTGINWQSAGTYYAGGGGGGSYSGGSGGTGGSGGGGAGRAGGTGQSGGSGSTNTGGGGGGGSGSPAADGGTGGSGVVVIRYFGNQRGAGGTISSNAGYTYHTFTSSGTFTA